MKRITVNLSDALEEKLMQHAQAKGCSTASAGAALIAAGLINDEIEIDSDEAADFAILELHNLKQKFDACAARLEAFYRKGE